MVTKELVQVHSHHEKQVRCLLLAICALCSIIMIISVFVQFDPDIYLKKYFIVYTVYVF